MKRVVISGYYGFGNAGDETMLQAMILALRQAAGDVGFTVLSRDPEATRRLHGVEAVKRTNPLAIRRAILGCDAFISGGGSLLQDATGPRSIPYYLGLALWAKLMGKPTVLYGQGIGPVRGRLSRRLLRLLEKVDLICLRDLESAELLRALGLRHKNLHVTADPVLFLGPFPREDGKNTLRSLGINVDKPLIGVFPRPWRGSQGYTSVLAKAVTHMASHIDGQALLIPLQPSQDRRCIQEMLSSSIDGRLSAIDVDLQGLAPIIAALDMVVSVRLHGSILASISGVPSIALSYDPKVDAFVKAFGLKALNISGLAPEDLMIALEQTWSEREAIRGSLLNTAAEFRAISYKNAEITAELLKGAGKADVLGFPFDDVDLNDALACAHRMAETGTPHMIITANPETLYAARRHPELTQALLRADMVVADGAGIVWASSVLGRALPGKVPGIDLVDGLLRASADKGWSIYLLGTREPVVASAAERLPGLYPGLRIAGFHHGYFRPSEEEHLVEEIKRSGARILLVALGVPRQEGFLLRYLANTGASLGIGVGGSIDVLAGAVKRAPPWIQALNLEWLYRLLKEPRRWRRQIAIPWFVLETLRYRYLARREAGR